MHSVKSKSFSVMVRLYRGFGHIAVMTPDVYSSSSELEAAGVRFQKRPNEGRMKGD